MSNTELKTEETMTWRKTLFRLLWKCGSDDEWFLYRLYISLRDYLAEKEGRVEA